MEFSVPPRSRGNAEVQRTSLGLGPSAANPRGIESAVVTAFKQGLIDQPVAALWLNKSAKHYGSGRTVHGEITYGGVDDEKCGPVSRYHDISASADQCE